MSTTTETTRAFCIKNMVSQDIMSEGRPWSLTLPPLPTFANKNAYKAWMSDPATEYVFFNLIEGEIPNLKVNKDNKPKRVHGVIADYDVGGMTGPEILAGLTRADATGNRPSYWYITRSGGVRLIWLFERPVWFYNTSAYKKFMGKCRDEFRMTLLFPGLDENALMRAEQYYTSGTTWSHYGAPIPVARIHLWQTDSVKDSDFEGGVEVPLDVVAAEAEKKFPGRWSGEWRLGARGVRFWDPSADAMAAVLRPTGVQCFTGDRPFMSWRDIFGREFVQQYLEDKTGAAIRDMYFDGQSYYRQLHDERWDAMGVLAAKRHLQVRYGLNPGKDKEETSGEIDIALHRVETSKRITGALPFPHRPESVVQWNGDAYLNTSRARTWPAALDAQEWGENFPFISSFLARLFPEPETLTNFLAWLHCWLKPTYEGKPGLGTALFIAGGPGTGKTFLTRVILGRIVGGYADVSPFFTEGSGFNSAAFETALWCLDDASPTADRQAHRKFSSLVKAVAANGAFRYEKKYGYSGHCPFLGRFICTLNKDPISVGLLPDTDQSLLDKVTLLMTGDEPPDLDPNEAKRYGVVESELSYFVRWVLDWELPESVERSTRFGVAAVHDRELLATARENSPSAALAEAIEIFVENQWSSRPGEETWAGRAIELLAEMQNLDKAKAAVHGMSPAWFGRTIKELMGQGHPRLKPGRVGEHRNLGIVVNLCKQIN